MEATATKLGAHWLDVMPAIPLAKWTPSIHPRYGPGVALEDFDPRTADRARWMAEQSGQVLFAIKDLDHLDRPDEVRGVRCNLDDPQGFGHALTDFGGRDIPQDGGAMEDRVDAIFAAVGGYLPLLRRWLRGAITDADRLALAQALAALEAE